MDSVDHGRTATTHTGVNAEAMFDAIASTPLGPSGTRRHTVHLPGDVATSTSSGLAAEQLGHRHRGPDDIGERARAVLRAAAWSMLLEPGDHAPYGWSHCLTMPQAVLGLAGTVDPSIALAVAATYVVGFRSALAVNPLEPVFPTEDPRLPLPEATRRRTDGRGRGGVAPPRPAMAGVVGELATRAFGAARTRTSSSTRSRASTPPPPTARTSPPLPRRGRASRGWWAEVTSAAAGDGGPGRRRPRALQG